MPVLFLLSGPKIDFSPAGATCCPDKREISNFKFHVFVIEKRTQWLWVTLSNLAKYSVTRGIARHLRQLSFLLNVLCRELTEQVKLSHHQLRSTTQLVSSVVRLQLTERVQLPGYSLSSCGAVATVSDGRPVGPHTTSNAYWLELHATITATVQLPITLYRHHYIPVPLPRLVPLPSPRHSDASYSGLVMHCVPSRPASRTIHLHCDFGFSKQY